MAVFRKSYKPKVYRKKTVSKPKVSLAVKKYVKRTMKPMKSEVKRQIDYLAEATMATLATPYLQYEFLTAQGNTPSTRVGQQVRLIGLHMNTIIKNNANITNMVRILILSCDGSTDITATTGEFFQDANLAGATSDITAYTGLKLMTGEINRIKFKVHYDKKFKLGNFNCTDSTDVKIFTHFHKFNTPIKYEGNALGSTNQNRRVFVLYLGAEGPEDIITGTTIEVTGQHKWYFTDA